MKIEEQRRVRARSVWMDVFQETNSVAKTSRRCGVPRSTIYRWLKRFEDKGAAGLEGISRRPKKLAKLKTNPEIEKLILEIRNKHKWGPQRIQSHFNQIKGPALSVPTIWRVLRRHNAKSIKKYRRHKDFKRYSRPIPGDRVQIDVTKIKSGVYQYTAVDDCTRLKVLRLYPNKNAQNSILFLFEILDAFGEIGFAVQRIQSDCGREFFNDAFQEELMEHFIKFRPNPPASPHLNGKVERGQKTDKEEFYRTLNLKDPNLDLTKELARWERYYNYDRPHSSLAGKTPYERFKELEAQVPIQPEVSKNWYAGNEVVKNLDWEKVKRKNPELAKKMSQML